MTSLNIHKNNVQCEPNVFLPTSQCKKHPILANILTSVLRFNYYFRISGDYSDYSCYEAANFSIFIM